MAWIEKTLKSTMSDYTAKVTVFDDETVGLSSLNGAVVDKNELLKFINESTEQLKIENPRVETRKRC